MSDSIHCFGCIYEEVVKLYSVWFNVLKPIGRHACMARPTSPKPRHAFLPGAQLSIVIVLPFFWEVSKAFLKSLLRYDLGQAKTIGLPSFSIKLGLVVNWFRLILGRHRGGAGISPTLGAPPPPPLRFWGNMLILAMGTEKNFTYFYFYFIFMSLRLKSWVHPWTSPNHHWRWATLLINWFCSLALNWNNWIKPGRIFALPIHGPDSGFQVGEGI